MLGHQKRPSIELGNVRSLYHITLHALPNCCFSLTGMPLEIALLGYDNMGQTWQFQNPTFRVAALSFLCKLL